MGADHALRRGCSGIGGAGGHVEAAILRLASRIGDTYDKNRHQILLRWLIEKRVPAVMLMRKAAECDRVPEWCEVLLNLEQSLAFAGPLSDTLATDCIRCAQLSAAGMVYDHDSSTIYWCQSCLGKWHLECAEKFRFPGIDRCRRVQCEEISFTCAVCLANQSGSRNPAPR